MKRKTEADQTQQVQVLPEDAVFQADPWMIQDSKGRTRPEPKADLVIGHVGPEAAQGRSGVLQPRGRFRPGGRSPWRQSRALPQHLAGLQREWAEAMCEKWQDVVDHPEWPGKVEHVLQTYVNAQGGMHMGGVGDNCTAEVERVLRDYQAKFRQLSKPWVDLQGFPGPPM